MVKKEYLISRDYLELPIAAETEVQTLQVFDKDTGAKIYEFQVPMGTEEKEFHPDFYARLSVKNFIGKTLILTGCGNDAFFSGIQETDREFGESDYDFSKESIARPQYHFTAIRGWINDPNGLVYSDGIYHLYFQYNPFDTRWENMSWGHATSTDLIHWRQQETVMYPDENGYMFSGSGFVNSRGCLGLPEQTLMFYYTAAGECRPWTSEKLSTQRLAFSTDGGKTLEKTDRGMVETISHENRDPKVFWHEASQAYIMILWVDGNEFAILRSENLEKWEISHRFELKDGFECPDLLRLKDENGEDHWFVTTADGYYYPGKFDGYHFTWNGERHGFYMNRVPYAAQVYSGTAGRSVLIPWLRVDFKGRNYTGAMGLPRELTLVKVAGDYRIALSPVKELDRELFSRCICDHAQNDFEVAGVPVSYNKESGKFLVGTDESVIATGLDEFEVCVDNGIVEVTADYDTMLGVYEV